MEWNLQASLFTALSTFRCWFPTLVRCLLKTSFAEFKYLVSLRRKVWEKVEVSICWQVLDKSPTGDKSCGWLCRLDLKEDFWTHLESFLWTKGCWCNLRAVQMPHKHRFLLQCHSACHLEWRLRRWLAFLSFFADERLFFLFDDSVSLPMLFSFHCSTSWTPNGF